MSVGTKLRRIRIERGITLRELARKVGCTSSFLSQVERDKVDPSISTLKKIASALNVNIVDFFMEDIGDQDVVTKVHERVKIHLRRWDAEIYSLIKSTAGKKMHPFYTIIEPGGGSHGAYTHEGEEFGFVLQGELSIILNGREYIVREGESFYFPSHIPHDWINRTEKTTVVLWVITPPSF